MILQRAFLLLGKGALASLSSTHLRPCRLSAALAIAVPSGAWLRLD